MMRDDCGVTALANPDLGMVAEGLKMIAKKVAKNPMYVSKATMSMFLTLTSMSSKTRGLHECMWSIIRTVTRITAVPTFVLTSATK